VKEWLEPQIKSSYLEIGIVGDLDVKEVIAAATATIGSLPARAAERKPLEEERASVKFPQGVKEKELAFDSKIPKSMALVFWPTTDRRKNVKLSRQLSLLSEVFSDRVRIKVREELGESYSPDVASMMSDTWTGYGQFMAMMSTDNKQAKKLTEIAREIGDKLAAGGMTEDELERARKPILTSLEEQRRNNAYWLGTVVTPSQSKPERLDWARTMISDFKDVTVTDLNHLAKEYLTADKATALTVVSTAKPAEAKKEKGGKKE
jgi:zinc protease